MPTVIVGQSRTGVTTDVDVLGRFERRAKPVAHACHGAIIRADLPEPTLTAGTRLGSFEIVGTLGAGGMGEVYRATDTKLKRQVALKVLPAAVTADEARLLRFQREAEVLASLNHPHIAQIYGIEESSGVRALVIELVEGPTLADRIARAPIPVAEALALAVQVARALEAAHQQGVVHRDLKPTNIKIRPDGHVKVLDFGLARVLATEGGDLSKSDTITSPTLTHDGVILGTAAYMSPEQARGDLVDKRTDVWALGCVLYEMVTRKRAFRGATLADTMAAVLTGAVDFDALPRTVNPSLRELLKRSLEKDPKRRWQDVAEVRAELEMLLTAPQSTGAVAAAVRTVAAWKPHLPTLAAMAAAAAVSGLTVWMLTRDTPAPTPRQVTRFTVPLVERSPGDAGLMDIAISPDGTQIVYVANERLYLRKLSDFATTAISGTETQYFIKSPVFSPDSGSIAYWESLGGGGQLKRIPVGGGIAETMYEASAISGLTWDIDGIVFGVPHEGVLRLSLNGGPPQKLVVIEKGEIALHPQPLPGGDGVLFTLAGARGADTASAQPGTNVLDMWRTARIVVQRRSGERKTLIEGGFDAQYLRTGHLVYSADGALLAVPFDPVRAEVTGKATRVVSDVPRTYGEGDASAHFSVSTTGSLIYLSVPTGASPSQAVLAFLDRNGGVEPLNLPSGNYAHPRLSPDGTQVAFDFDSQVWVYDLSGKTSALRITYEGRNHSPVWSPDGRSIAFASSRGGDTAVFRQPADGSGTAERLTTPEAGTAHVPDAWSSAADCMLFSAIKESTSALWMLSLRDGKAAPLDGSDSVRRLATGAISPDGRWIANGTNGSLFVQPFPSKGVKYQIAKPDSHTPRWSRGGEELFFIQQRDLVSVSVSTKPRFAFGVPSPALRRMRFDGRLLWQQNYDVTSDGQRIIGVFMPSGHPWDEPNATRILVVENWLDELTRLVRTR
jgi:serine/threonine-protein kinase